MRTVNVHAAKTHLSQLLEEVRNGEEIVIAKAGEPVARLVPMQPAERPKRRPGTMRVQIGYVPGYDPVASDPEIVAMFEEGDIWRGTPGRAGGGEPEDTL